MLPSAPLPALRTRTRPDMGPCRAHRYAENDFTVLFKTLADDPDTYLEKDAATYSSAVGRSFYSQIIPSNSVTWAGPPGRSNG